MGIAFKLFRQGIDTRCNSAVIKFIHSNTSLSTDGKCVRVKNFLTVLPLYHKTCVKF